jgi:hypothetical protein
MNDVDAVFDLSYDPDEVGGDWSSNTGSLTVHEPTRPPSTLNQGIGCWPATTTNCRPDGHVGCVGTVSESGSSSTSRGLQVRSPDF